MTRKYRGKVFDADGMPSENDGLWFAVYCDCCGDRFADLTGGGVARDPQDVEQAACDCEWVMIGNVAICRGCQRRIANGATKVTFGKAKTKS